MAKKKTKDILIEIAVEKAFNKFGDGRQFSITDLSKIMDLGIEAGKFGLDIEQAVKAACDSFEKKL